MTIDLHITSEKVSGYMDRILKLFKPGAKITVLVRSPLIEGDTDFILTNDDLPEAIKAIERQQQNHESKPASPI